MNDLWMILAQPLAHRPPPSFLVPSPYLFSFFIDYFGICSSGMGRRRRQYTTDRQTLACLWV